jgi:hypothetical protein
MFTNASYLLQKQIEGNKDIDFGHQQPCPCLLHHVVSLDSGFWFGF